MPNASYTEQTVMPSPRKETAVKLRMHPYHFYFKYKSFDLTQHMHTNARHFLQTYTASISFTTDGYVHG